MKHEIINKVIFDLQAKSYLEIGYGLGDNFDKIGMVNAFACDPNYKGDKSNVFAMSSDDYFDLNPNDFDVVFIDGDHTAEQVRKDIVNSLKRGAKAIIIHDVIPHSKEMQEVPRNTKVWTGDCWRAVVGFIQNYPDVNVVTYRADFGLTVIYPEGKKVKKHFENKDLTYEGFKANEVELLNIID